MVSDSMQSVESLSAVAELASTCTKCRLAETRTQVVFGVGSPTADLLFIGEAPGKNEDLQGEPFVGRSGQLLDKLVAEELSMFRSEFYIANAVKCRPPENRDPKPDEIAACRPWLEEQLRLLDPKVIITLGNFATRTILQTTDGITKLRGRVHPFGDRWLVPTFHPSAALRTGADTIAKMRSDLVRAKRVVAGDKSVLAETNESGSTWPPQYAAAPTLDLRTSPTADARETAHNESRTTGRQA